MDEADQIRRAIILKLFSAIIMDTPVLTGRARGNWQTNVGNPVQSTTPREDKDGGSAISEVEANMGELGEDVYITNNLPYIHRLEYEGWSHTKAPEGMFRKNITRFEKIFRDEARKSDF